MKSTPPLDLYNRFSVLAIDENESYDVSPPIVVVPSPPDPPVAPPVHIPFWERKRVPRQFIASSLTNPDKSLELSIELRTTDTGAEFATRALVDSGATGSFIDQGYVRRNGITTRRLARPVAVYNIDGSPNEAGFITEVVDLILRFRRHAERHLFAVTSLGQRSVILGYPWLRKHNPDIDWETRTFRWRPKINPPKLINLLKTLNRPTEVNSVIMNIFASDIALPSNDDPEEYRETYDVNFDEYSIYEEMRPITSCPNEINTKITMATELAQQKAKETNIGEIPEQFKHKLLQENLH